MGFLRSLFSKEYAPITYDVTLRLDGAEWAKLPLSERVEILQVRKHGV